MSLLVAGTIRVPLQNLVDFRPHMLAMLTATRAEDGCLDYTYAEDVAEPGLIRVFEVWRDQAALTPSQRQPSCRFFRHRPHGPADSSWFAECATRRLFDAGRAQWPGLHPATSNDRR